MNNNIDEAADRIRELIAAGDATKLALKIIIAECVQVELGQPVCCYPAVPEAGE